MRAILRCKICGQDFEVTDTEIILHIERPSFSEFQKIKGVLWQDSFICKKCLEEIHVYKRIDDFVVYIGKWGYYFYLEKRDTGRVAYVEPKTAKGN